MKNVRLPLAAAITTLAICGSALPNAGAVGTGPGTVELASITPEGASSPAAPNSVVSGDGTKLAIRMAKPGDVSGNMPLYLRDLSAGTTTLLFDPTGDATPTAISHTGRFVAYTSSPWLKPEAFVQHAYRVDTTTGATVLIDQLPNGQAPTRHGSSGGMSPDGRFVTFLSSAPKLVDNDVNNARDLFLRDLQTGETRLIGKTLSGGQVPAGAKRIGRSEVVADGSAVFFQASAASMGLANAAGEHLFKWDRATDAVTLVSARADGTPFKVNGAWELTSDGQFASLSTDKSLTAEDTDTDFDVYRFNTANKSARLVSIFGGPLGELTTQISPDGVCISFKEPTRTRPTLYYPGTGDYRRIPSALDGLAPNNYTAVTDISRGCSTVTLFSSATNLLNEPTEPTFQSVFVWHDN